jgi:hypothetical protein
MKTARLLPTTVFLFAATVWLRAQGTLYLSNLGDASGNGTFIHSEEASSVHWLAAGFETGEDADGYTLDSVQVLMDNGEPGLVSFNISIYTDDAAQPGTDLEALSGSPTPYIAGTYTYTSSGITLSPSTSYWIVMSPFSSYGWDFTELTNSISSDGWNNTEISYDSTDQGSTWNDLSGELLQFGVDAQPAPEPSILALLVIGAACAYRRISRYKNLLLKERFPIRVPTSKDRVLGAG